MANKFVPILVALLHFIGWTIIDIIIWKHIIVPNNLYSYGTLYHIGWWVANITMFIPSLILLYSDKKSLILYILTWFVFSCTSIEDICYYWFELSHLPKELFWLNDNPFILFKPVSATNLLVSSSIWLTLWVISIILILCIKKT